jgi:GH43 family beta-xylosidase
MQKLKIIFIFFLLINGFAIAQTTKTFTNPLLPAGADPYSFYKNGYYYYTHTTGNCIVIWKTKNLAELKSAEKRTIFIPPSGTQYSKEIWAPQIQFIKGKWYTYFAADDGSNKNHRLYVLENASDDPMKGKWIFKAKVADPTNKWAIDGDVFEHGGVLYMIWSGWQGDVNFEQDIYIAKMKNPWTIEGARVRISAPVFEWEKNGDLNDPNNPPHVNVNEGPQILKDNNKLFIVYSASGCWTDFYALGLLTFTGNGNLLDSASWKKNPVPVFQQSKQNGVYAPGHNSFFKSPDGKEDWILYHANAAPGLGCGRNRSPRAQKFTWNADGTPNFGIPVKTDSLIPVPSEMEIRNIEDKKSLINLADPTIFHHRNLYYLYGTVEGNANEGFLVYTSVDMKLWKLAETSNDGYALKKGDAYGTAQFWAPQVFYYNKKFYMAYTANENIAIAESKSPLGPFKQKIKKPVTTAVKQIDPFVFIDDDGKKYLYHVKLTNGNRLFVAEMKDDFSAIKPETLKECITATESWENTASSSWPVAEGPAIIKNNGLYYFLYSANDFRNPDYAVGYAVSISPYGPWKKYRGNPIINKKTIGTNGTGHGDIFKNNKGESIYVFHTHNSDSTVSPRKTAIVKLKFVKDTIGGSKKLVIDEKSFYYLHREMDK